MRILLDHNLPRKLRGHLTGHEVTTTRQMLWEDYRNGALLSAAADAGYDVFLSIDKNLEFEQNLIALPLPVVVLDAPSNAISGLLPLVPHLQNLLAAPLGRLLYVVQLDGTILQLRQPRR